MRKSMLIVCISALALLLQCAVQALELPNIFSSHMVIQRDARVPIWGNAAAGATVSVEFAGQKKSTVANDKGIWILRLDPLKASAKPQKMTVSEQSQTITYEDVLVGDNWLCSGQSNMEFQLMRSRDAEKVLAEVGKRPNIRFFHVAQHIMEKTPQENAPGTWATVSDPMIRRLTAVGYFFARRINEELGVPVGIIQSGWGGKRIEHFLTYTGSEKDYLKELEEPKSAANAAKTPDETQVKRNGQIYNGMIAPLAPFGIKGVLWYQGEANGKEGDSYFDKMKLLISGWRKVFGIGDLPFYYVQLASYQSANPDPAGGDGWARLREAQRRSLKISNTGMAVAIDLADADNTKDIHPKNKQDVGGRLAQWALYQTYGKSKLVPSGPLFKSAVADGNRMVVSFDYVGGGLIVGVKNGLEPVKAVKNGKLKGFAIAGEDRKWVWADAVIDEKTVIVSSPEVPKPVAVRYAFSMNPMGCNLYNKEGLPASPFRSDNW